MSIASEITRLQGVKADILQAIADKGVTVPAGSTLADCPDLIAAISGGGSGITVIEMGGFSSLDTKTITQPGTFQLIVLAINSEASSYLLDIDVTKNSAAISGTLLKYKTYDSYGTDRRNYRLEVYDISLAQGDIVTISCSSASGYTRIQYILLDGTPIAANQLSKSLSSADKSTSGSYSSDGIYISGETRRNIDGNIRIGTYTADTTVVTNTLGDSYCSSFIFWI